MSITKIIPFPSAQTLCTGSSVANTAEPNQDTTLNHKGGEDLYSAPFHLNKSIPPKARTHTSLKTSRPSRGRTKRKLIKATKNTVVFNFKEHWHEVEPFLHHPNFELALTLGVDAYRHSRAAEGLEHALDPKRWLVASDAKLQEPIYRLPTDYWLNESRRLAEEARARGEFTWKYGPDAELSDEELRRFEEFADQFWPAEGSFKLYQLWGAGHGLALAFRELGQLVFPALRWKLLAGEEHSLAYGENDQGEMVMIFDILNFETMSAEELVKFATAKSRPRKHRHTVTSSGTG